MHHRGIPAHINFRVKIPALNIQATVTKLEDDIALSPDSPCPEVQPPPNLAPNVKAVPPMKACQAGIAASAMARLVPGFCCSKTKLPAMTPKENMMGLDGGLGFPIFPERA